MCGKVDHHLIKGAVDSESRNFLIKGSYRQGLESILIGNNRLD